MTNEEIKQELKRSALNDNNPFMEVDHIAFDKACEFKDSQNSERMQDMYNTELRMFYLIVAEAL
jgi:hypothetical protein